VVANLPTDQGTLVHVIDGATADQLRSVANLLKAKGFSGTAVLFGRGPDQIHLLVTVDPSLTGTFHAGKIVQELTGLLGGKGGGRPEMARGVGKDQTKLDLAKQRALELMAGR
jgi:alanyl-tRNA synthetase